MKIPRQTLQSFNNAQLSVVLTKDLNDLEDKKDVYKLALEALREHLKLMSCSPHDIAHRIIDLALKDS